MGQSRVVKRKKFKLVLEPNRWEPNSMYYIRPTINDDVKIYVTDINGIPFEVEGESGGGIELVRNSDGYLTVSGQNIVTINISQNLLDLINTKLSQGDNISNLVNDEGYIKLVDIANKLDKVESVTANTQMYVKNPDGTQGMMDVSNLSGISGVKKNGTTLPIVSGEVDVIVPETTSELINDSGYITENDVPIETLTRNGQLLNITNKNVDIEVPTQTSQLTNDAGFITQADIPPFDDKIEVIKRNGTTLPITNKEVNVLVPTNISELNNDENFISEAPIETISVNSQNIPIINKNVNIETITEHSGLYLDDGTNPHGTTKTDVGLGNVDNTSDLNKPISIATQDALDTKLDKNTSVTADTMMYIKNPDGTQGTLPINHRVVLLDTNPDGSVSTQGVSGVVLLKTYPIGKLKNNSIYRITSKILKEGTEAIMAQIVSLNNDKSFPLNLPNSGNASNLMSGAIRHMKTYTDNGQEKASSFTISGGFPTDIISHSSTPTIKNINFTQDNSITLYVSTTSLTDRIYLDYLLIEEISM